MQLETVLLHVPLAAPLPVPPEAAPRDVLEVALVRLTHGDLVAYGEAGLDDPADLPEALEFFEDALGAADPRDWGLLAQRLDWALRDYEPSPLAPYVAALSALDVALWDLAGQALGQPVWRLLGGRRASRADTYVAGLQAGEPDLANHAQALRKRFASAQIRLTGKSTTDVPAVRQARRALGENYPLRVDAAGAYPDAAAVRELGQALEPMEVLWLQDPLPPGDWAAWGAVAPDLALGVAGGRELHSSTTAARMLAAGAVDVLTPDLRRCGGLSGARRLADLALAHRVGLSLIAGATPLSQLTAAHLTVTLTYAGPVEVQDVAGPLGEMLEPALRVDNGFLLVPDGPGLGTQVSSSFVDRYQVEWPS